MKTNKHKHAELMALFAQDAMETETPWERWEYRYSEHGEWLPVAGDPPRWMWDPVAEYRRKPKTIRIGEYDVPEPCREPLTHAEEYWIPRIERYEPSARYGWEGSGDTCDLRFLRSGLIHRTREAAETHAKALLSLTARKTEGGDV